MPETVLTIPVDDSTALANILNKFATDAFEVMKFLEAFAAAQGFQINRREVMSKLLDIWDVSEEDKA
jgi:hypothetical protein